MTRDEDIYIHGYYRLINAVIKDVFSRVRISGKWISGRMKITSRALDKKQKELDKINEWLKDKRSEAWLSLYYAVGGIAIKKTREEIVKEIDKSQKLINKLLKKLDK